MPQTAWDWTQVQLIPSSLEAGHRLIEHYMKVLDNHGWEGRDLFHVQLAIEEAVVNAITHGNKESSEKQVEVELRVSKRETLMRIRDQGAGFRPDLLPDPTDEEHLDVPHGRGVMLIRQMMDKVEYNECGNQVTMIKQRTE